MGIFWKPKNSDKFNDILVISEDSNRYAYIPAGHCLFVSPNEGEHFLAIALKTEQSTIKNVKNGGGKKLGKDCPYYQNEYCSIRNHCEILQKNRSDFFDQSQTRTNAVRRANEIASEIEPKA